MASYFKSYFYLLVGVAVFLIIKVTGLGVMISDTNIYFVTASRIAEGAVLYRDVFFTNFPVFPYVSVFYYLMFSGDLLLYYYTSSIEAAVVSVLIFYIVFDQFRDRFLASVSSAVYLFSFIVLSTSDHQTGVFLASVFALLGYIFYRKERIILCGLFVCLSLLVKAYFLPIAVAIGISLLLARKYRSLLIFCLSGTVTGLLALLPFFIVSRTEFVEQIFEYSLFRGGGLSKFEIARFFVFHDLLLFVVLLFCLFSFRKNMFFSVFAFCSILFFLFYQDVYYLYLNYMVPFLCVALSLFFVFLEKMWSVKRHIIVFVVLFFLTINLFVYFGGYRDLQRVPGIHALVDDVIAADAEYIYGDNGIAPAVSHLSGIPQLEGIVDTNPNIFRKGLLDANDLTQKAIEKKTVIVTEAAYYPQRGVVEDVYSEVVNREMIHTHCTLVGRYPVHAEGLVNALSVIRCYE